MVGCACGSELNSLGSVAAFANAGVSLREEIKAVLAQLLLAELVAAGEFIGAIFDLDLVERGGEDLVVGREWGEEIH